MTRLPAITRVLRLVRILPLACAAGIWLSGAAHAATVPPDDQRPTWASLSPAQKAALAPLQRDWASIDSARKEKWIEVAARLPSMPEAERNRIQERMNAWARMTPAERGRARLQFQETRQISPADRQARWDAYQALPEDERLALAQRAKPAASAPAGARASRPTDGNPSKVNLVNPKTSSAPLKAVAPTVVQAKPGASTTLMSTRPPPPTHQQPGLPKIAATEGFVNPATLLPRRGPQGAAVKSGPAASAPTDLP